MHLSRVLQTENIIEAFFPTALTFFKLQIIMINAQNEAIALSQYHTLQINFGTTVSGRRFMVILFGLLASEYKNLL